MYWIAKKQNGEIITLSEREALVHSERNNISQRQRLEFIGVCSGDHQEEAKKKIKELVVSMRPEDYYSLDENQQKLIDYRNRQSINKEAKALIDEAFEKEIEEAKTNGYKPPRKSLHFHTPRGRRAEILSKSGNMQL